VPAGAGITFQREQLTFGTKRDVPNRQHSNYPQANPYQQHGQVHASHVAVVPDGTRRREKRRCDALRGRQ
jgi:hypothetical protein